jgi:hypothetical protein
VFDELFIRITAQRATVVTSFNYAPVSSLVKFPTFQRRANEFIIVNVPFIEICRHVKRNSILHSTEDGCVQLSSSLVHCEEIPYRSLILCLSTCYTQNGCVLNCALSQMTANDKWSLIEVTCVEIV